MNANPNLRISDDSGKRKPVKVAFTLRTLRAVVAPAKGRRYVYDDRQPGLAMSVTSAGHKAFYFYAKHNGEPVRVKLGDLDAISIEQARKLAARKLALANEGVHPSAARREARAELTLGELHDLYKENTKVKPSTRIVEDSLWNTTLAPWKGRKLTTITALDVVKLHAKITKDRARKPDKPATRTANRAVQYLRRLYRHAEELYGYRGELPTAKVKLHKENKRTRFLTAEEFPAFIEALDAEPQPFPDFFRLAMFTGMRRRNVCSMRWADIDLKAETWTVPGPEAKEGEDIVVQLTPEAVAILKRRKAARDGQPYVFPAVKRGGKHGHLSPPQRPKQRICARAGIEDFVIHDLRHTLASYMAMSGASLPVIGKALGHRDHRSTARYAHLSPDAVRGSVAAAVASMTTPKDSKSDGKRSRRQ